MSNKNSRLQITVTPVRQYNRKPKPTSIDEKVGQYEQKLLDLISDPTSQYLTISQQQALTKSLVNALHSVRMGLVIS